MFQLPDYFDFPREIDITNLTGAELKVLLFIYRHKDSQPPVKSNLDITISTGLSLAKAKKSIKSIQDKYHGGFDEWGLI